MTKIDVERFYAKKIEAFEGAVKLESNFAAFWENIEDEWAWREKKNEFYPFDGENDPYLGEDEYGFDDGDEYGDDEYDY